MRVGAPQAAALLAGWLAMHAAGGIAGATTVVPMDERDLVAASAGAVIGRVARLASAAEPTDGAIYTYVTIAPERVVFGPTPDGEVVLRELGGRAGGREHWVFGSPEYTVGERVLVFLSLAPGGTLRTTALGLGKYRIDDAPGGAQARRTYGAGTVVIDKRGRLARRPPDERLPLNEVMGRIVTALHDAAAPAEARRPIWRPDTAALVLEPRTTFKLLQPVSRWFEPDEYRPVGFRIDATGDAALGPEVSRRLIGDGLAAWSAIPAANLRLVDAGLAEPAPFAQCPGDSRIVFNDPFGELNDPFGCHGILAIGGFCTSGETRLLNGVLYRRIIAGKVTFNSGWSDCPIWTECNVAEIAAHEVGHAVGFGHSEDPDATLFEEAHFDGRCAALRADDEAAAVFLYPIPPTPTRTPTATPSPPPSPTPTRTRPATRTPSRTRTPTRSGTPTPTRTATRTPRTPIPTPTAGATSPLPLTATPTSTRTAMASATPSATPSPSRTSSPTVSPTPTATPGVATWLELLLRAIQRLLDAVQSRGITTAS